MLYVAGFFVDIAEILKIPSVKFGLYPFRNEKPFFEILTLLQFKTLFFYALLMIYFTELRVNQYS